MFSAYTSFLTILQHHLKKEDKKSLLYCGLQKQKNKRGENLEKFKTSDEFKIFLASKKSGSCGLNITAANHVIITELGWHSCEQEQMEHRSARFGQKKNVFVYYPLGRNSIEIWKLYKIAQKDIAQMSWTKNLPKENIDSNEANISEKDVRHIYSLLNEAKEKSPEKNLFTEFTNRILLRYQNSYEYNILDENFDKVELKSDKKKETQLMALALESSLLQTTQSDDDEDMPELEDYDE